MRSTILSLAVVAFLAPFSHAEDKWTPSPLCPYPSEELTRSPYEGDCTKYWECYEGARYPMDCPSGLEYNEAQHRCDTPSIAQCDKYETITYPTYPHSDSTATSPGWSPDPLCPYPSDSLIYYPFAEDCTEYWQCYNGDRVLKKCPSNLYWSVVHNWCDYLENVDCSQNNITLTPPPVTSPGTRTQETTEPGTTGPWTPDPLCPYPSEAITYYVYPANCSQYWECYEGNKYLMNCPGDLVWNEEASVCDYRTNVNCQRSSTTQSPVTETTTPGPATTGGTTNPTTRTTTIDPTPSCTNQADGTFIADPNDCSHFYECAGGKAVDEQCPGDLLWNEEKSVCDFAENVDC